MMKLLLIGVLCIGLGAIHSTQEQVLKVQAGDIVCCPEKFVENNKKSAFIRPRPERNDQQQQNQQDNSIFDDFKKNHNCVDGKWVTGGKGIIGNNCDDNIGRKIPQSQQNQQQRWDQIGSQKS